MPYRPPLHDIFLGAYFLQIWGWGWWELFSQFGHRRHCWENRGQTPESSWILEENAAREVCSWVLSWSWQGARTHAFGEPIPLPAWHPPFSSSSRGLSSKIIVGKIPTPIKIREKLRATTKGQNRFRISHFFHNFSHFFIIFPPRLSPSKQRVWAQGEQKRRKDN